MSVYTATSKRVGWDEKKVDLPTMQRAQELLVLVRDNKDQEAFYEVFNIHRHCESPTTDEGHAILNIICESYQEGQKHFQ